MEHFDDVKDDLYDAVHIDTNKKRIRIVNKGPHEYPEYSDPKASGFDLRAWITDDESEIFISGRTITIGPLERRLIHTGIYVELPKGTELQIRPKSGQALKKALSVVNTPGTIDNNYRGEICVVVVNLSNMSIHIQDGEKIAQAVLCPVYYGEMVEFEQIDEVSTDTERGAGGFGHTGIN